MVAFPVNEQKKINEELEAGNKMLGVYSYPPLLNVIQL
jgi:hypothetical protein